MLFKFVNRKKHGVAVFFWRVKCRGVCPKPRHKGLFVKSPLQTQKLRQNKVVYFGAKVLRIFKGLFQKPLEARLGTQFQLLMKNKKRGFSAFFGVYYQLWLSAPNPDTRDFSRKVPWNLKSLARINLYVRCEVLWLTFLRKKGVFTVCV